MRKWGKTPRCVGRFAHAHNDDARKTDKNFYFFCLSILFRTHVWPQTPQTDMCPSEKVGGRGTGPNSDRKRVTWGRCAGRQERGSRESSTGEARGRSTHRDLIHLDEQQKQVSHIKTSVGVTLNVSLFTSCLTWSNLQRLFMKVSVQNELHINRVTQETCFYINYRNIIIYFNN